MRARRLLLVAAVAFSSVAARHRPANPPTDIPAPPDVFSAAAPDLAVSTHIALDLAVDFDSQIVRGSVTHTIVNRKATHTFVVDTSGLDIDAVSVDGQPASWTFGAPAANGTPLVIDIDPDTTTVRIDYRSRPSAGGLHWMTAKQTRDGVMPALWSENEPDLARSWIPLQDTPSVRVTYDATVRVPAGELALMSAANNPTAVNDSGVYTFSMPHSIPSYLIAITVARLGFRELGARTGVYAEPALLDDTAYEMQFVPDMLLAGERIAGPYPFERYDLVFPPKYAGGMENPELNFIGQDAITGNHPVPVAINGVIAHELSHTWFGDEVTLATWNDLWLNEGFATYFEKRIEEGVGDPELAELVLYIDRNSLTDYLASNPPARLTVLHRTFIGDERPAFTIIWYQKGEMFLETMERTMGRAAFDAFLRSYVSSHAFHWVDDVAFRSLLLAETSTDPALQARLQVDDWIYGSGVPANLDAPTSSVLWQRLTAAANTVLAGAPASSLDTSGWSYFDLQEFLGLVNGKTTLTMMDGIDAKFGLSQMNTPPLGWLVMIARTLRSQDRTVLNRYLARGTANSLAVWSTLGATNAGRNYAIPLFNQFRDLYDPATQVMIVRALGLS